MAKTKPINIKPEVLPAPFERVLPAGLGVGKDELKLRLDFYEESIVMQTFEAKRAQGSFKMVSAKDISSAMSRHISFTSGLLPESALWWSNTGAGEPEVAIWVPPGIRRLALMRGGKAAIRYNVPLPGLIFLCKSGKPPKVYAALKRPTSLKDRVFKAPLSNVYDDGRTCPGSHQYPADVADIPNDFFTSFFTAAADIGGRSKKYPKDVTQLWRELNDKQEFPASDLVVHGIVEDLVGTGVR